MSHILCIWELGADLGHFSRLAALASEFIDRGHRVTLAVKDLSRAQLFLRNLPVRLLQSPVWQPRPKNPGLTKTVADILGYKGYGDVDGLRALVKGWRSMFEDVRPDLLVFDYAPTAMFSARDFPIPGVIFSGGFFAPAPRLKAMDICPWVTVPAGAMEVRERYIVDNINAVGRSFRLPDVDYVGDLFAADKTFITDLPSFDLYASGRQSAIHTGPPLLESDFPGCSWGSGSGVKVFLYLKPGRPHVEAILESLADSSANVRGYYPGPLPKSLAQRQSERFSLSSDLLNMNQALETADTIVTHGGSATLCDALLHGRPVFSMPTQIEQKWCALRLQKLGVGAWVDDGANQSAATESMSRFLEADRLRQNALRFAEEHSDYDRASVPGIVVEQCESLI